MQRIFLGLACIAILLLLANAVVGLTGGDFNAVFRAAVEAKQKAKAAALDANATEKTAAEEQARTALATLHQARPHMTAHILLGSGAAVIAILVCSISITYFVGTSRWSKEVVETYHLSPELAAESARIKRRSFPWALLGMLTMLGIVALGAAADPSGMNYVRSASWVQVHYISALASIALMGWSFLMQGQCLAEHYQLIEKIMAEVRRIREARGLDSQS